MTVELVIPDPLAFNVQDLEALRLAADRLEWAGVGATITPRHPANAPLMVGVTFANGRQFTVTGSLALLNCVDALRAYLGKDPV